MTPPFLVFVVAIAGMAIGIPFVLEVFDSRAKKREEAARKRIEDRVLAGECQKRDADYQVLKAVEAMGPLTRSNFSLSTAAPGEGEFPGKSITGLGGVKVGRQYVTFELLQYRAEDPASNAISRLGQRDVWLNLLIPGTLNVLRSKRLRLGPMTSHRLELGGNIGLPIREKLTFVLERQAEWEAPSFIIKDELSDAPDEAIKDGL